MLQDKVGIWTLWHKESVLVLPTSIAFLKEAEKSEDHVAPLGDSTSSSKLLGPYVVAFCKSAFPSLC